MDSDSSPWPSRLDEARLAVPGVIGVRELQNVSFRRARHVLIGADAGFPEFQQLDDWKSEVAMVDARALAPEQRAAASILLPEEELAEIDAFKREMAELDLAPFVDPQSVANLRIDRRARLRALTDDQRRALEAQDVPFWVAGYTRHSNTLWIHRVGGPGASSAWISQWDAHEAMAATADRPPPLVGRERFFALRNARWADRVLRALSGGAVSEPGLLFARRQLSRWDHGRLVEDDLARSGVEAARRMAAGQEVVHIPRHGRARRVRLAGFELRVWGIHPLDAQKEGPWPTRTIAVPPEDAWVLIDG